MEVDTTIVSSVELNERTLTTVETAPGDLEPATACPVSKATNVATVRINMLYLTIARPRFHSGAGVAPKQGAVGVRDAHVCRSGWVGSASRDHDGQGHCLFGRRRPSLGTRHPI